MNQKEKSQLTKTAAQKEAFLIKKLTSNGIPRKPVKWHINSPNIIYPNILNYYRFSIVALSLNSLIYSAKAICLFWTNK